MLQYFPMSCIILRKIVGFADKRQVLPTKCFTMHCDASNAPRDGLGNGT